MTHRVLWGYGTIGQLRGTVPRPSCTPSCSSVRPSACSAASPPSPAPTSTSSRARSCCSAAPNGAGKTTLLRVCAGLVPVAQGEAVVLGHDLSHRPRRCARRVGLLGPRHVAVRRPHRRRERPVLGRTAGRLAATRSTPRWRGSGSLGRLADVHGRPSLGRPAPAHCARRRWSPAGPSCGCSTSPTPASTPTARDLLDALIAEAIAAGAHRRARRPTSSTGRARSRTDGTMVVGGSGVNRRGRWSRVAMFRDAALSPARTCASSCAVRVTLNQVLPFAAAGARAVRVRARPRPRAPRAGHAGLVLDRRALLRAARRPAGVRHRGGRRRRATGCGCRASTRPASSSARRAPSRCSCSRSRPLLGVGVAVLYGTAPTRAETAGVRRVGLLVVDRAPRHDRAGRRRHALRRPRRRIAGAGHPAAPAVPPGGRTGPDRRHPGVRGGAAVGPGNQLYEGWPWVGLLAGFAGLYMALGLLAFGALLEES